MAKFVLVVMLIAARTVAARNTDHPRYVTGMVLFGGSSPSCPLFVGGVQKNSPAAHAGVQIGDRLVAIDGHPARDIREVAQQLISHRPATVTVDLARGERPLHMTMEREDRTAVLKADGWRMFKGEMVPLDATDAEAEYILDILRDLRREKVSVAFPGHYPADKELGFEAFIWSTHQQVTVGGIEDGPARRAGVRWGDRLVAINGVDPDGKSVAQLESLLSSPRSARMELIITRGDGEKVFSFDLEQASQVLRENHWRVLNAKMIPLWVPQKYLKCFQ